MGVHRPGAEWAAFSFPILGTDADNGSEFINAHLLAYCKGEQLTFTRRRSGNKNDACTCSRRTGPSCATRSATTGTTPPPN